MHDALNTKGDRLVPYSWHSALKRFSFTSTKMLSGNCKDPMPRRASNTAHDQRSSAIVT